MNLEIQSSFWKHNYSIRNIQDFGRKMQEHFVPHGGAHILGVVVLGYSVEVPKLW